MEAPLAQQVGGKHYKGMAIEPFTFGMKNAYDPAAFSIMKYVSRHHLKGGAEDLRKAIHIVYIRVSEMPVPAIRARNAIPVEVFITENNIPSREADILRDLHQWACGEIDSLGGSSAADWIVGEIDALIENAYPEEKD